MNLSGTQLKDTYGNLVTTGTTAGSPTTGGLQNGDGALLTSVGIGTNLPASGGANTQNVHIHNPNANSTYLKLSTSGTGSSSSDGLDIAIDNSGNGYLINRENANIHFYTNGDEKMRIEADGDIAFYDNANNQGLFWDASEASLGIGNTSPASFLSGANVAVDVGNSSGGEFVARRTGGEANLAMGVTGGNIGYLYSTTNTPMVFGTNNAEAMRIDSSGNVTIKASGADQARTLSLQGTNGASETYQFNLIADGENAAAKFMVGVGGGAATERMRIGSGGDISFRDTSANEAFYWDASEANLLLGLTTDAGVTDGLTIYKGSGTAGINLNANVYGADYSILAGATGADAFGIYDNDASAYRMLIDSNGQVGIGETNPTAPLQIKTATSAGNAKVAQFLTHADTTSGTEVRLAFAAHTNIDIASDRYSYISALNTSGSNGQALVFATNAAGAGGSEKMRIDSSGNVDIKTVGSETSPSLFFGGDGDTGFFKPLSNTLAFSTFGSERMRIASDGEVTIKGSNSSTHPALTLQNTHGASGSQGSTKLEFSVINSINTDVRSTIISRERTTDSNLSELLFSVSDNGAGNPALAFTLTGGASAGDATFLRMASGTGGIQFNGDTATANALDDYEEGTWSPIYTPSSGSFTTMTMNVVSATYTKIGRQVTVRAYFTTNEVVVGTASSALSVSGLPFTSATSSDGFSAVSVGYVTNWGIVPDAGYVMNGSTRIRLRRSTGANDSNVSDLTTGATANQNQIMLTSTYFV